MMGLPLARTANQAPSRWVHTAWGMLIWAVGLVPMVVGIAAPRLVASNSYEPAYFKALSISEASMPHWVALGIAGFVLGVGGIVSLVGLTWRRSGWPRAGLGLWLGAMALAFGPLLSSRLGAQPEFSPALLGVPLIFTAAYLLPPVPLSWFVRQAKRVLLLYAYGSLLAVAVAPQWALEPYASSLVPGFDVRLRGLANHPNNLAPLLVACLILSWFSPSRSRLGGLHWVVVMVALSLTQSKTAWILLIAAYLIRLAYSAWSLGGWRRYTALALAGAAFTGSVLYLAVDPIWPGYAQASLTSSQLEEIGTLSGRTLIWQATTDIWAQSPLFGYGPGLWGEEMRLAYMPLLGYVPHAHNQFLQTLGESGIVGSVGLSLYAITLLVFAVRYIEETKGVALVLVSVLLLRGITEPLFVATLIDANFYVSFLVYALLLLASRQKRPLGVGRHALKPPASPAESCIERIEEYLQDIRKGGKKLQRTL